MTAVDGVSEAVGLARSIEQIRDAFPGLADGRAALDGAAGTQLPAPVIEAVVAAMRDAMANVHGSFPGSGRSTETVRQARLAVADLVGGTADGVLLGPNMTTLTFMLADTLARSWGPGDEIVVTSLDHDANIRPWVLAAQRARATVRWAEFDVASGELPAQAFDGVIGARTKLVAVTAASNAIGTRPDVRAITDRAHHAGALTYVDGVHATPHAPTDIAALGADFYACSSYKWFGPHTGSVIADPALLATLTPSKLVPSPNQGPERFERGTASFEQLAGVAAAVDWIAGLTGAEGSRRQRVLAAMGAIERYLEKLAGYAREGLAGVDGVRILGAARSRTSTISFTVRGVSPADVAVALDRDGVNVWDGDNYAYELMQRFGLGDSGGAVRASLVLYNDRSDVQRLVNAVAQIRDMTARIAINGIEVALAEHGPSDGPVVVLLHGFPELGFSWRHQVGPLAAAGYRVLVPDMRGFGDSDAPEDAEQYAADVLADDVLGLLDHAGAARGTVIGHDWGADVAWKTAWLHPERVLAVAGLSVPFTPRAPAPPLGLMRKRFGEDFYMVWFQEPGVAERALSRDVRRTLATTRVWDAAWAADTHDHPQTPPFMTDDELDVYVRTFTRTGFRGGLNYYRNLDRNWERTAHVTDRAITAPALFLTGERDPVRRFMPGAVMDGWVTDLRVDAVIDGAGHWVQQQAPQQVNSLLLAWLADVHG